MNLKDIPKAYTPKNTENNIYKKWEDSGYFNPDICLDKKITSKDVETFCLMMPPPNVTGVLHLGHAFENALMDIQTRYQRMQGKRTLWLPGTDHAAVATQARVEKMLIEERNIKNPRQELGREKLLQEIREYAENAKSNILNQVKRLGSSCDWSRLAYTFDDTRSKCVTEIFVRMFNDGLIYKGYRVINWSVKGQSTCSDDELVHIPRTAKLYYFKYSKDFPITIATTRPETKLGDTAVAVHPDDDRYKNLIGQTIEVKNFGGKNGPTLKLKIIADKNIDKEYGTGALGVTPAHSPIDYEMYLENKLELVPVIDHNGKMTDAAGSDYKGLTTEQARDKVVEWLESQSLLEKVEDIEQNVSTSDRFGDIVEAIPMTQWFVNVNKEIPSKEKTLKDIMKEVFTNGLNNDKTKKIEILPDRFLKTYFSWIDNLRDWCISRQIWWGHQIPVYYQLDKETYDEFIQDPDNKKHLLENIEPIAAHEKPTGDYWVQEPDTLDTWFSSGTWPFSTLDWPEETQDLKTYYPTTWMQMGYEIIFFWMARMILMSGYALDDIPFKDVYIHGILRDKEGRKFSKSLGNGIDPLEMIDKYGADALRLSLIADISPGNDSRFYEEKVEYFRNLINKIWNISRFTLMNVENPIIIPIKPKPKTLSDKWILQKLDELTNQITNNLNNYQFSICVEQLRDFTWHEFADWYLEIAKVEKDKDEILLYILQTLLKLWHPFAPYITEHLWEYMGGIECPKDLLMIASWPQSSDMKQDDVQKQFTIITEIITSIRNMRSENKIAPAEKLKCIINTKNNLDLIKKQEDIIKALARLESIEYNTDKPDNALIGAVEDIEVCVLSDGTQSEDDKKRIQKEIENLEQYITSLKKKLSNEEFTKNAPAEVVKQEQEKLQVAKEKLETLRG